MAVLHCMTDTNVRSVHASNTQYPIYINYLFIYLLTISDAISENSLLTVGIDIYSSGIDTINTGVV